MTMNIALSQEDWPLQRRCEFLSKVYGLWSTGLTLSNYGLNGEEVVTQWSYRMIHNHQRGYFLEGLRKLGVDPEKEPPAVVAGKYHFLSNGLGGLDMEYVEESPKKVWIRYNPPSSGGSTGSLVMPPSAGRATFQGWHARNGELLGNLKLGFVLTRGFSEEEPYGEGYFKEYDHELAPEERIQYDSVSKMPEFDPETAPKLDSEVWPPDRRAKALRNFARGYVEESITTHMQMMGTHATARVVAKAFRGIAIQFGRELLGDLNITEKSAMSLAIFTKLMGDMEGDSMELTSPSPGEYILRRHSRRLLPPGSAPAEVHRAMFAFTETLAKIMNLHRIKVGQTALMDEGAPYDEITFQELRP